MPKQGIEQTILEALEPRCAERGLDLVDVEVVGATKAPCVRVRIDHADEGAEPISLDEVAAETEWISEAIDALDPISSSFMLEVSSPGLDRPLRRPRDFERFAGQKVALTTTAMEGQRKFTGTLLGFADGCVRLEVDGEEARVALDDVRKCNVKPDFGGSAKSGRK